MDWNKTQHENNAKLTSAKNELRNAELKWTLLRDNKISQKIQRLKTQISIIEIAQFLLLPNGKGNQRKRPRKA